jgi:Bacterial PH domain
MSSDMSDFAELQKRASALRPLTLPGSRTFAFCYAGGSSALIALGLVTLPFNPFLLPAAVVALVAVFVMAVMTVTPGATSLAIDDEGITRCLMFRTVHMEWQDVASVRSEYFLSATFPIAWNRQVFTESRHDGSDGLSFFPHQFGLNAEQAIELLAPYLENARRKSAIPQDHAVAA